VKIEKPDWFKITTEMIQRDLGGRHCTSRQAKKLDEWFKESVEPINEMLANAVEVYGPQMYGNEFNGFVLPDTHKALLINITEIKKDSLDSVFEDFKK